MTINHAILKSKERLQGKRATWKTVLYFVISTLFQHPLLCWHPNHWQQARQFKTTSMDFESKQIMLYSYWLSQLPQQWAELHFFPLTLIGSLWKHNYLCSKINSFKFYKTYSWTSKFLVESQIATGHAEAHELYLLTSRWHITSLRSQIWKQKTAQV